MALEAIRERETLNELAVKYEVSPVMISRCKKEFIENSAAAFSALICTIVCKAGIQEIGDTDTRRRLISPTHDLSGEWSFNRSGWLNPYAGIGLGLSSQDQHDPHTINGYDMWRSTKAFTPVANPYLGLEFWNRFRVTFDTCITRKEWSTVSIRFGFVFGGGWR